MIFLSGATIPMEVFPSILKTISMFVPSTYLVQGIKGMMGSGKTITEVWPLLLILVIAAAVGLTVGFKLFRWEKEKRNSLEAFHRER